jgi:AraC-like DNA-binding protein
MKNYEYLVDAISTPTDDCLIWPHCASSNGYGRVRVDGETHRAHRLALELTKPRPAGKVCSVKNEWVEGDKLHAAHGPCHNRSCFNPQHLSWKTRAENQADRKRDGTHQVNENHGACTIPDTTVARSRELWEGPHRGPNRTGPTLRELAEQFGCSRQQIHRIVNGHARTPPVTAQPNEELQQV